MTTQVKSVIYGLLISLLVGLLLWSFLPACAPLPPTVRSSDQPVCFQYHKHRDTMPEQSCWSSWKSCQDARRHLQESPHIYQVTTECVDRWRLENDSLFGE